MPENDAIPELDTSRPTPEVGSEGGSPGDLERNRQRDVGTGSEAGTTWHPTESDTETVKRDETGIGRRSPEGNS
jgi:hypothetical protein